MNKEVVYPHSFRHRFAKNFLDQKRLVFIFAVLPVNNRRL